MRGASSGGSGGLRFLVTPTADAGLCPLDPCDPYCLAYNEDAAVQPEGGPPEYYFSQSDIFGGSPAGFAKKSDCGSDSLGCNDQAPGSAPSTRT